MTKIEWEDWTIETAKSVNSWRIDIVQWHNNRLMLAYKGGVDGQFLMVDKNGKMEAGTYEGALPHIGEALFTPKFTFKFDSQEAAFEWLRTRGDMAPAVKLITAAK